MNASDLVVLIPLCYFAGALAIPVLGASRQSWARGVAIVASLGALSSAVAGLGHVARDGTIRYALGGWQPPLGIELVLDSLSGYVAVLVSGVGLLVLVHSGPVVRREHPEVMGPFYSSALLLLGGLAGILVTGDLFNLFVFLEISSIASYALLALGDPRSPFASFRYLILGSIGAAFYLLGLGFLFLTTGSLNMADVSALLPGVIATPAALVGLALITAGLALKMGLFPVHHWLPDAYSYASSSATALIAPISTKVAAYVLIRMFFYVSGPAADLQLPGLLGYLGAAAIVWGSVLAIAQRDLKRMLAYSSVGQIGYIALGIGLASPLGLTGAVLHTLNHAVMKGCLFLVSANLGARFGHSDIEVFDRSTCRRMPWTAAAFAVAAISMIGLPPTAGFFSKWYLVIGSLQQDRWLFVAAILASSLLNAVYFFRVIERIYIGRGESERSGEAAPVGAGEVPPVMLAPTLILASAVIVLGLANVWILEAFIAPMIPAGMAGAG
jgi:multicomponent Na+:H+ antiporter subunit D